MGSENGFNEWIESCPKHHKKYFREHPDEARKYYDRGLKDLSGDDKRNFINISFFIFDDEEKVKERCMEGFREGLGSWLKEDIQCGKPFMLDELEAAILEEEVLPGIKYEKTDFNDTGKYHFQGCTCVICTEKD